MSISSRNINNSVNENSDDFQAVLMSEIELKLQCKVSSIKKFDNKYWTSNSLYIICSNIWKFFVKVFCKNKGEEFYWYEQISQHVPTIGLQVRFMIRESEILIYEYFESETMVDLVLGAEGLFWERIEKILEYEKKKNDWLKKMYTSTKWKITWREYLDQPVNRLFMEKLTWEVFDQYYSSQNPIAQLLKKKITLNGIKFPRTWDQILQDLKEKAKRINPNEVIDSVYWHWDIHHFNVLIWKTGEIKVIDFEYASLLPINMEMAKPYYIDLIGVLFFFFQDILDAKFSLDKSVDTDADLNLEITYHGWLEHRIAITKEKIGTFSSLLNWSKDFFSFNDYVVMAHVFSHNPNNYSEFSQLLFAVFLQLLDNSNLFYPEKIFRQFQKPS